MNWRPSGPFLASPSSFSSSYCHLNISLLSSAFCLYSSSSYFGSMQIVSSIHPGISFEVPLTSTFPLKSAAFPATKIHFSQEIWRASFSPIHSCGIKIFITMPAFQKNPSLVFVEMDRKGLDFQEFVQPPILILIGGNCRDALVIGVNSLLPAARVTRAIHKERCQGVQMNTKELVSFAPHFV